MARLSLCMIVRDEAERLRRCLASVRGLVDEVVIVDTGSSDGTVELARRLADRFAEVAWDDDFSAARNASLDLATGDWILVLDADEVLEAGTGKTLRRALDQTDLLAGELVVMNRLGEGRVGHLRALRLFRNRADVRFTGLVHEQVAPALEAIRGAGSPWRIEALAGCVIEHDGYLPEIALARGKTERNVRLLRRALETSPDDIYLRYKLSRELRAAPEGAEQLTIAAQLLLDMDPDALPHQALGGEILTVAALAWGSAGRSASALHAASVALEAYPEHPVTRLALGLALLELGRLPEARTEVERALLLAPPARSFYYDTTAHDLRARLALADILRWEGDHEGALVTLEGARRAHESSAAAAHAHVELLLASDRAADSLREAGAWLRAHPGDVKCLAACAAAADRLGRGDVAEKWRRRLVAPE